MALRKKLNIKQLLKKNYTNSKVLQNLAYGAAKQKSDKLKRDFLKDFDAHPVTREIKQGPSGMASSLLGGRGNFFGFLGCNSGQQPIEILRDQIENNITILNKKGKVKKISNTSFVWQFDISVPSKADIYNVTPMTWSTKSWVKGVERGITNYSNTIFKESKNSRSGVAIQVDSKVGFIKFNATPYVTQMLDRLKAQLK